MLQDIQNVLYSEEQIHAIVADLGAQISRDYAGKNPLLVSILKGSVVFMADLMRAITIPCEIDFMATSSYGADVKTSGVVKLIKDLDRSIEGRHLIIVEDILDSGMTLSYIMEMLETRDPADIRICTLFDKPSRRQVNVHAAYAGIEVPDEFIVGYGLDYNEKYRNHDCTCTQQRRKRLGDQLTEGINVIGVIAHDVAVLVRIKIADRKILHLVEHRLPLL